MKNRHFQIIPSIASADPLRIDREIERLGGWPKLHYDIEDGNFVPNITFGTKLLKRIVSMEDMEVDVHLLANHPEQYLDCIKECNIRCVAFHIEAVSYPLVLIRKMKYMGIKAGIALNFLTPIELLKPFMDELDYVLIMTAEPDGEGQKFYPPMLDKIRKAKKLLSPGKEVWADGGIGEGELEKAVEAGADTVIMGRSIFESSDAGWELKRLSFL